MFNGDDCWKIYMQYENPNYKKTWKNWNNMLSHLRIKSSIFILNFLFQIFNTILHVVFISKQFYRTYGQNIMSLIFFLQKKILNLGYGRCWQSLIDHFTDCLWKSTTMCRHGPKYSEISVSNVTALSEIHWPSNELGGNNLARVWSALPHKPPGVTIGFHKV